MVFVQIQTKRQNIHAVRSSAPQEHPTKNHTRDDLDLRPVLAFHTAQKCTDHSHRAEHVSASLQDIFPAAVVSALQSFVPPLQSFVPPLQSFVPPLQSFVPPLQSFVPPLQSFVP
eukprot:Lankesteria_metandrocarpae@DN7830_c0_g1_i1.p1